MRADSVERYTYSNAGMQVRIRTCTSPARSHSAATAAALWACELCPDVRSYLIAAHRSADPGHQAALEKLELELIFTLDLRPGEGTGAALALPVVDAALAVMDEMATFSEAGVSGTVPGPSAIQRHA